MRMGRTLAAEIIGRFSLFSLMMVALSLFPTLSHAAIFWDDEMEAGKAF